MQVLANRIISMNTTQRGTLNFFTSFSHPILFLHFLILPTPPPTPFHGTDSLPSLPYITQWYQTYRTIRQHIAKEKGHITERQENVTYHQQDLTKQKQLNST